MSAKLQIKLVEWLDPGGARGDELRATWARLEIAVGDNVATRVMDLSSARSVRDAIYVPAYPLAEWIVTHWWFLLFERDENRPGFDRRHSLHYAGDGFAFPPIRMLLDGIKCGIEMESKAFSKAGIQFLERFESSVDQSQFMDELTSFVSLVCTRLEEQNVHNTLLQKDWAAICSSDQDEVDFCRAAASMGSDPYALEKRDAELLIAVRRRVSSELLWNDLTEAASLKKVESCVSWIDAAATKLHQTAKFEPLVSRHDLNGASHSQNLAGWQQGYKGARNLWASGKLGREPGSGRLDWSTVIKHWNGSSTMDALQVNVAPTKTIHALIEAGADQFGMAIPFGKSTRKDNQAFLMARALSEYLWCGSSSGKHSMLTTSQAWRQQRSRAFAAELLAPSSDLRLQLSGSQVSNDEIDELAEHYGVSDRVIRHQIRNHEMAIVRD